MANQEVVDEEILMYDADGNVTEDEDKAVTAEVTQTLADGNVIHTLMRSQSASS